MSLLTDYNKGTSLQQPIVVMKEGKPVDPRSVCATVAEFETVVKNIGIEIRYDGLETYETDNKRKMVCHGSVAEGWTWTEAAGDTSQFYTKEQIDELLKNSGGGTGSSGVYAIPSDSQFYGCTTARKLVDKITNGWNLGDSLESTGSTVSTQVINTASEATTYETMWQEPVTTKAMLQAVKDAGFNAIRIPVTWAHHIIDGGTDMKISPYWMARVKEIVDWCIELDLIAIVNTHHDHSNYGESNPTISGPGNMAWLYIADNDSDHAIIKSRFYKVWAQIADTFADYDNRVVFEAYNEIQRYSRNWSASTQQDEDYRADLAQTFVDAVRNAGGNNVNRFLCINTYAAQAKNNTMFTMPTDSYAMNSLMMQIHTYSSAMYDDVDAELAIIKTQLLDKYPSIPLIIGENGTLPPMTEEDRALQIQNYVAKCKELGIKQFWWDTGEWRLLVRNTLQWKYPLIVEGMMAGCTSGPLEEVTISNYSTDDHVSALGISFGALDYDGSLCTDATGVTTLNASTKTRITTDYIELAESGSKIKMDCLDGDNQSGYRVLSVAFYDEDKNFLYTKCSRDGATETPVSYSTLVPKACKYVRFSIYNPWQNLTLSNFQSKLKLTSQVAGGLTLTLKEYHTPDTQKVDREDLNQFKEVITLTEFLENYRNEDMWQVGEYNTSTCMYEPSTVNRLCTTKFIAIEPDEIYKISLSGNVFDTGATYKLKMTTYGEYNYALPASNKSDASGITEFTATRRAIQFTLYATPTALANVQNEETLRGIVANEGFVIDVKHLEGYHSTTIPLSDGHGSQGLDAYSGKVISTSKDWIMWDYYDVFNITEDNRSFTINTTFGTVYLCEYKTDGTFICCHQGSTGLSTNLNALTRYIRFCTTWYNDSTVCKLVYKSDTDVTAIGATLPDTDTVESLNTYETKKTTTGEITYDNGLAGVVKGMSMSGSSYICIGELGEMTVARSSTDSVPMTYGYIDSYVDGITTGQKLNIILDIESCECPEGTSNLVLSYQAVTDVGCTIPSGTTGLYRVYFNSKYDLDVDTLNKKYLSTTVKGSTLKIKRGWVVVTPTNLAPLVVDTYKLGCNSVTAEFTLNGASYTVNDSNGKVIALNSNYDGKTYDTLTVNENNAVTITRNVAVTNGVVSVLDVPVVEAGQTMQTMNTVAGTNTFKGVGDFPIKTFSVNVYTSN